MGGGWRLGTGVALLSPRRAAPCPKPKPGPGEPSCRSKGGKWLAGSQALPFLPQPFLGGWGGGTIGLATHAPGTPYPACAHTATHVRGAPCPARAHTAARAHNGTHVYGAPCPTRAHNATYVPGALYPARAHAAARCAHCHTPAWRVLPRSRAHNATHVRGAPYPARAQGARLRRPGCWSLAWGCCWWTSSGCLGACST